VRKQYHFWPAASGSSLFDAWDVDTLITLSAGLPIEQVDVASIGDLDTDYWSDGSGSTRTVRQIVEHARLMLAADLSYPVILGFDGRVMDGMHRIARALLDGREQLPVRRFRTPLPPDHVDVRPDELSYER
jgi:hypothetical protein